MQLMILAITRIKKTNNTASTSGNCDANKKMPIAGVREPTTGISVSLRDIKNLGCVAPRRVTEVGYTLRGGMSPLVLSLNKTKMGLAGPRAFPIRFSVGGSNRGIRAK